MMNWGVKYNMAIEILAKGPPLGTVEMAARAIEVQPSTVERWMSDSAFQARLAERVRTEIRLALPAAKNVLLRKALEDGDRDCLKLIMRIAGLQVGEAGASQPPVDEFEDLSDEQLLRRVRELAEMAGEESAAAQGDEGEL